MIMLENKFNIGEIVYLITDPKQYARMVVSLEVGEKDLLYYLSCGTNTTKHFAHEISKEVTVEYKRED